MERKLSPTFRRALKERCGTKCYICGEDGADLIPLWMGGEDKIENFIALCSWHHMLMHRSVGQKQGRFSRDGRPSIVKGRDNYEDILDEYIECRIGASELKNLLGMTSSTAISDRSWFKKYKESRGIAKHRNNVDIHLRLERKTGCKCKTKLGWVEYADGTYKEFYSDAE